MSFYLNLESFQITHFENIGNNLSRLKLSVGLGKGPNERGKKVRILIIFIFSLLDGFRPLGHKPIGNKLSGVHILKFWEL